MYQLASYPGLLKLASVETATGEGLAADYIALIARIPRPVVSFYSTGDNLLVDQLSVDQLSEDQLSEDQLSAFIQQGTTCRWTSCQWTNCWWTSCRWTSCWWTSCQRTSCQWTNCRRSADNYPQHFLNFIQFKTRGTETPKHDWNNLLGNIFFRTRPKSFGSPLASRWSVRLSTNLEMKP